MIIPITEQEIKKGDIVINIRSIEKKFFIIPPGHEFKIINCDKKYGYYVGIDLVETECPYTRKNMIIMIEIVI